MRKILLPLLAVMLASCAWRRDLGFARQRLMGAATTSDCYPDGAASVCRWTPTGMEEDQDSVLFFLHYATGDEKSAARVGVLQSFYRRYKNAGRRPPRVFSISYGDHWLISARPGQRQVVSRGEFEGLLRRAERTSPQRRYLWGMSMGGYNAAEEALSSPLDWTAAVLHCAALQTVNPFDAPTKGLSAKRRDGFDLFKTRLGSPAIWEEENPLTLAAMTGPGPAFLIETNAHDEFGFQPGARALADALNASGKSATFRELPGTHCAVDGAAAANFLLSLSQ